jgi:hypothetical protein
MDLLCGAWGSNLCTPKRLFHFLGDLSNGNTPITINFMYEGKEGVKVGLVTIHSMEVVLGGFGKIIQWSMVRNQT